MATAHSEATALARRSERIRNGRGINLIRTAGVGVFFLLFVFFGRIQGNAEWQGGDVVLGGYLACAGLLLWASRRREEVAVRSGFAMALLDVPMFTAIQFVILPGSSNPQELVGSCVAIFVLLILASGILLNVRLIIATAVAAAAAQAALQLQVALDISIVFSSVATLAFAAVITAHLTSRLDRLVEKTALQFAEALRAEKERGQLADQLRAAQKMEAIGSLAGGIAHDFNNLISVILNYAGFALDRMSKGDAIRDDILQVKKAGERAALLTRQLLAFGRKQVLQPVQLDLNLILADMEKMLRRIIREDVDLVRVQSPGLGMVKADPGQIEQVIMNLVVNARDAMPEGGKLTIETSNVELDAGYAARDVGVAPGPYVLLAVTDTGCGMSEQTLARIFEPFFTTKEKGKGTGLGLSTVYGIVKQSGGNIWVYSELGKGTTFKVYLPRELATTVAATVRHPVVPRQTTGTETILAVDDEEALREVARRTLGAAGYTVLTAADGTEALEASTRHPGDIHLLLTDVVMPHMNGRMLAQELRRSRPTVKVLYMSGYADDAIVHNGVLDAGTDFLGKPFTAADLRGKVREVLDGGTIELPVGREQVLETGAETKEPPLDPAVLRAVPVEVLGKLRQAAIKARYDDIVELVETIRSTQPDAATGLRRLADAFDYDGLRDLLGR